jgi:hypothetical protein
MPHARLHVRQAEAWPALPLAEWKATCETLHMWAQIVGKVRLALAPPLNHGWHASLFLSARGLTTALIPLDRGALQIDFDFFDHSLIVLVSDGRQRRISLPGRSVAGFYRELLSTLRSLGIDIEISPEPVAVSNPIPFVEDNRNAYDEGFVQRFWHVLLQAERLLQEFRGRFVGKTSGVQLRWLRLELATARFSGRPAAVDHVDDAEERWLDARSHEVSNAGFWPGNGGLDEPAFYLDADPEPEGFARHRVYPAAACYHKELGRFILPYQSVRTSQDPDALVLAFFQSGYDAVAELAQWDRSLLERKPSSA